VAWALAVVITGVAAAASVASLASRQRRTVTWMGIRRSTRARWAWTSPPPGSSGHPLPSLRNRRSSRGAPHRALTTRGTEWSPRWTSMTSPTTGGQARQVNFSLPLLRAFSADWRPRWRRGRAHDDTRTRPYPDPPANRAGGSHPDKRDQNSPPTSPPLAPLLHPRHARKEDGPR
jgi:hypothetical protein